ncbi:MAG: ATP-dependent DNA helicase [Methanomassiliicoccales archaeon]|nr:ATP-dependent DNA helicase [Methanomassiliicoccales archaeon]
MTPDNDDLFPFTAPRLGQREFLRDARECMSSGKVLVAHAPTGLGKTAVALSAALESSLRTGGRTVFLTPRQSQHRAVVETVKMFPRHIQMVDLLSRESMCPFGSSPPCLADRRCHLQADGRMARCAREVLQRPLHAQELIALSLRRGTCPYLTARLALNGADLIVGDFSRAFGDLPDVLRFQGCSRPQNLVVDEAHNLPSRIMDAFSKELTVRSDEGLDRVWKDMLSRGHRVIPVGELRSCLDSVGLPEPEELAESEEFVNDWMRFGDASVRLAFPSDGKISMRFLEPSLVVQNVLKYCAGALFMSGTLHPPEVYAARMGLEGSVCRSYSSPFDPERRLAIVVPEVGTRYRERCRERTAAMAHCLARLSDAVPGNVMVFLPSYSFLSAVHRDLRGIKGRKQLLAERPGLSKGEKDGLVQRLLGRREVLMLCNIHGSFSEGVDFPPGCLAAVMVAGLPIPPPSLERKEMLSRTSKKLGQDKARTYLDTYEALSKVLQACGRAIRREEDRAAVLLLDPRYLEEKVTRLLPPDLRFSEGDPVALLRDFFAPEPPTYWSPLAESERIITGH